MNAADRRAVIARLRRCRVYMMFHTHWDREWYSTATVYQHRAVEFMERVFAVHAPGTAYPAFYLDGQTALLDDYLTLRPHQRGRLRALIRRGRLQVGPWYVMPEEHQPSGESHIRNLETGLRLAAEFGDRAEKVGYLADPITYIPQMPQILRKSGIRFMLHGRGITRQLFDSPQEQLAVAPDGSKVFLLNLSFSYYMDFGTTYETFCDQLFLFAARNLIHSSTTGCPTHSTRARPPESNSADQGKGVAMASTRSRSSGFLRRRAHERGGK